MRLTLLLILVSILMFLYPFFSGADINAYYNTYGFSSASFFERPWSIVTSVFLHGSIEHLVSNVLVWIFFGIAVESEMGSKKYLTIFFAGAFFGNFLSMFFYSPETVFIGASAGIFALIGAGMLVRPLDVSFYPLIVPIPLALLGLAYIIFNVYSFLTGAPGNISYIGHIGGLFVGFAFGFKKAGVRKSLIIVITTFVILLLIPVLLSLFL